MNELKLRRVPRLSASRSIASSDGGGNHCVIFTGVCSVRRSGRQQKHKKSLKKPLHFLRLLFGNSRSGRLCLWRPQISGGSFSLWWRRTSSSSLTKTWTSFCAGLCSKVKQNLRANNNNNNNTDTSKKKFLSSFFSQSETTLSRRTKAGGWRVKCFFFIVPSITRRLAKEWQQHWRNSL